VKGDKQPPREHVYEGIDDKVEDLELYKERALEAVEDWAGGVGPGSWTRPARDGMTICWSPFSWDDSQNWESRRIWDSEYHK